MGRHAKVFTVVGSTLGEGDGPLWHREISSLDELPGLLKEEEITLDGVLVFPCEPLKLAQAIVPVKAPRKPRATKEPRSAKEAKPNGKGAGAVA